MTVDDDFLTDDFDDATEAAASETARMTLPGVALRVVEGNDRGKECVASRDVVRVGSAPDSDLVLTDPQVSRRHFEVRLLAGEIRVVDLGSTNGTSIDGVSIVDAFATAGSLVRVGKTALRVATVDAPIVVPLSSRESFGALLGKSVAMRSVFALLERAARTDATVLIEGETGTGKELVAEALHHESSRREGPFVVVDCGSIPRELVESELFGHVRGAFTGASSDRRGLFEEADGGTLFLDELGELPLDLQPKLLRALERREVRRVGSQQPVRIDVRVVAATNRDLAVEVNRGRFREDLFHRLAVVRVRLPPLRQRREDLPMLVEHFARRLGPIEAGELGRLVSMIRDRPLSGNVRELKNVVEQLRVVGTGDRVDGLARAIDPSIVLGDDLFALSYKDGLERLVDAYERRAIDLAMAAADGSVSGAARQLGITRRGLQKMLARHRGGAVEGDER